MKLEREIKIVRLQVVKETEFNIDYEIYRLKLIAKDIFGLPVSFVYPIRFDSLAEAEEFGKEILSENEITDFDSYFTVIQHIYEY